MTEKNKPTAFFRQG